MTAARDGKMVKEGGDVADVAEGETTYSVRQVTWAEVKAGLVAWGAPLPAAGWNESVLDHLAPSNPIVDASGVVVRPAVVSRLVWWWRVVLGRAPSVMSDVSDLRGELLRRAGADAGNAWSLAVQQFLRSGNRGRHLRRYMKTMQSCAAAAMRQHLRVTIRDWRYWRRRAAAHHGEAVRSHLDIHTSAPRVSTRAHIRVKRAMVTGDGRVVVIYTAQLDGEVTRAWWCQVGNGRPWRVRAKGVTPDVEVGLTCYARRSSASTPIPDSEAIIAVVLRNAIHGFTATGEHAWILMSTAAEGSLDDACIAVGAEGALACQDNTVVFTRGTARPLHLEPAAGKVLAMGWGCVDGMLAVLRASCLELYTRTPGTASVGTTTDPPGTMKLAASVPYDAFKSAKFADEEEREECVDCAAQRVLAFVRGQGDDAGVGRIAATFVDGVGVFDVKAGRGAQDTGGLAVSLVCRRVCHFPIADVAFVTPRVLAALSVTPSRLYLWDTRTNAFLVKCALPGLYQAVACSSADAFAASLLHYAPNDDGALTLPSSTVADATAEKPSITTAPPVGSSSEEMEDAAAASVGDDEPDSTLHATDTPPGDATTEGGDGDAVGTATGERVLMLTGPGGVIKVGGQAIVNALALPRSGEGAPASQEETPEVGGKRPRDGSGGEGVEEQDTRGGRLPKRRKVVSDTQVIDVDDGSAATFTPPAATAAGAAALLDEAAVMSMSATAYLRAAALRAARGLTCRIDDDGDTKELSGPYVTVTWSNSQVTARCTDAWPTHPPPRPLELFFPVGEGVVGVGVARDWGRPCVHVWVLFSTRVARYDISTGRCMEDSPLPMVAGGRRLAPIPTALVTHAGNLIVFTENFTSAWARGAGAWSRMNDIGALMEFASSEEDAELAEVAAAAMGLPTHDMRLRCLIYRLFPMHGAPWIKQR